ncbi:MAG TPA: glycosyltransferase family 39 protein [Acidimicrobiales bacterium]|nr:glycosyltransferase family 39 protein [Acidimicrobiales bacterium]
MVGALAFVAYLPGLGRSLDFDSAETVGRFVRIGPPWAAFQRQAVFNNHPTFSFLEQLVRVVTGRTDASMMRVLPILFGALAVAVLTWFVVRRFGLVPGLVAGALLASNPTFVELSRSVRGYSLLTLCAIVSTVIVAEDRRTRRADVAYVIAAGIGLATHLYMVPVLAAHLGVALARRDFDKQWRTRFLSVGVVAGLAYVGMARAMVDAATAHARVFQVDIPWRIAQMTTGGGWVALVVAPLALGGAVIVLRRSRPARGAAAALAVVMLFLWVVQQSSALDERFFVWLVPGVAYLAAVAVARFPAGAIVAGAGVALAIATALPGYTNDPTAYRQAAALIGRVDDSGGRSCVVGVGVSPMLAYLDTPRQFAVVTDPAQVGSCDVVVVASWWPTNAPWFAADSSVIAAAEREFPNRTILDAGDPALVLSRAPIPRS